MEDSDDKKPWHDAIKWDYESARLREASYKLTLEKLAASKKVQKYLKGFDPSSVETSLSRYAWQKARWVVEKEQTEWCLESRGLRTPLAAQECLGNIQQKKLFDKQCLWRAELFEHPTLEVSVDFSYWEHNILNCPFIEPVTEDDVELYIQFLSEYLGEDLSFLGSWQDYNTYNSSHTTVVKMMAQKDEDDGEDDYGEDDDEEEEDGSLMPPWYQFVNQHTGDGHYLLLPDKRQEKEWYYSAKANKERVEKNTEQQKTNSRDSRPSFNLIGKEEIEDFIYQVEEKPEEIINARNIYEKLYNEPDENEMYWAREAWEDLDDCFEPFPVAAGITDWKKALIATAKQWTNTKIIRALPMHYDEYLFRRSAGIAAPFDASREATYRKMANDYKETILRGRELSGEPRDFNF